MACCAFAIFLLAQIFAPFRALARRLGLARDWQPDAAVEWRPGTRMPARKGRNWLKLALGVIAVDLALVGVVGAAAATTSAGVTQARATTAFERAVHKSICGTFGWRE